MPLQNRVTPWSEIVADENRGLFMGNRGRLHDDQRRLAVWPQTRRADWTLRRWIICRLIFHGRRRVLMSPGSYTELFFLDEATALAAGHRPCAECMRDRAREFVECWRAGNPALADKGTTASARDRLLHDDRRDAYRNQRTHRVEGATLPDGTMIEVDEVAYLVLGGAIRRWSFAGYGPPERLPGGDAKVLTPRTTVEALRAGYQAVLHPSATLGANQVT